MGSAYESAICVGPHDGPMIDASVYGFQVLIGIEPQTRLE